MKKILLAIIAITALIPSAPASAESRTYAGQTDGALQWCPFVDTTLPCINGANFARGGGTYNVSVSDDVASEANLPVPFQIQALHPLDVTGAVPPVPPRVIVQACGSANITVPDGYTRVLVFLVWARPGVNTTNNPGAVTPNQCITEGKPFLPPTMGTITLTP